MRAFCTRLLGRIMATASKRISKAYLQKRINRYAGRTWGAWKLETNGALSDGTYWVDIEHCYSSFEVIDWIVQVSHKTWASHEMVGALVEALDEILNIQGAGYRDV